LNRIVSTKSNSIFLAIILVTGTIAALSSQSSFIVEAQGQSSNYYGMNNNYEKSYNKDNRDKSKDSKTDIINKIKCINTNLNINGNNVGDVNLGNKGEGYLDPNSLGDGHYDGYNNKKVKDFDCTYNNNNNNAGQGIAGPPSPPGLPGNNQINSDNLYLALGNTVFISSAVPVLQSSIATCDEGDVVFEGGYQTFSVSLNSPLIVTYDGPLPDPAQAPTIPNDSAYQVTIFGTSAQFRAFAYCLDNPPLAP
jgi:hypothetical protein